MKLLVLLSWLLLAVSFTAARSTFDYDGDAYENVLTLVPSKRSWMNDRAPGRRWLLGPIRSSVLASQRKNAGY